MGGFYDSIHIRAESCDLVREVLTKLARQGGEKFFLAPVINGWVSVYPSNYWEGAVSQEIAKEMGGDVLHMMVHDDDVFRYLYYRNGDLIDEYNSRPGYFGEEVSRRERKRLRGKAEAFRELVGNKAKVKKIRRVLKPQSLLTKIQVADEIKEAGKKLEGLSKQIDAFINDQSAMLDFLEKNPELFKEEFGRLAEDATSQGIKSTEDIQKFLEENEKAREMTMKIVGEYVKSRTSSEQFDFVRPRFEKYHEAYADMEKQISDQFGVNEKGRIEPPDGLMASHTMFQFAEILGIPNAITSYKYLKDGDTEGVEEWEGFVEID